MSDPLTEKSAPARETPRAEGPVEVKNVASAALAEATMRQKPSLWTRNMFQLYFCVFIATLNAAINGYDGSLMSSINSYRQYREYFGFSLTEGTPSTGIVFAIFTIGNLVSSFIAGPASDFRGRRVGMFIGAATIIIGSIVQASAQNLAAFMIGRFLLGFGAAFGPSAALSYVAEIAHPAYRGAMTGVYTTFYFVGSIPGTFVPYGTSTLAGTPSWRIPVWLQMVFSGIVLLAVPFLPESPRWLIANDRHADALAVMARLHGEGDPHSPLVALEYGEMVAQISQTGSDKRWWDYRGLAASRPARRRTLLCLAVAVFGQWSGNATTSYYYPQMLAGAGITSNHLALLLQGVNAVIQFAGALLGAAVTDRVGRRPQLLVSTSVVVVLFAVITALNATNLTTDPATGEVVARSAAQAKAEVAVIFLFGFVFAVGWTPLQGLYATEVLRFEDRAKGMALYTFVTNICGFYNTFVTGIAFSGAGWKYYYLFIFWDIFEVAFIYLFFVETKNRTLEELDVIFKADKPVKESLKKAEVLVDETSGVVEVLDKAEA
ncbi:a878ca54-be0e-416f-9bb2-f2136a80836f [Neofusicoccum parvum]|nr:a878ca54-be0e-416f-9bb2-f2136a80836f [Neofusicoccum parvum]